MARIHKSLMIWDKFVMIYDHLQSFWENRHEFYLPDSRYCRNHSVIFLKNLLGIFKTWELGFIIYWSSYSEWTKCLNDTKDSINFILMIMEIVRNCFQNLTKKRYSKIIANLIRPNWYSSLEMPIKTASPDQYL